MAGRYRFNDLSPPPPLEPIYHSLMHRHVSSQPEATVVGTLTLKINLREA